MFPWEMERWGVDSVLGRGGTMSVTKVERSLPRVGDMARRPGGLTRRVKRKSPAHAEPRIKC